MSTRGDRAGWRKSRYSTNGGDCVEVAVMAAEEAAMAAEEAATAYKAGSDTLYVLRDSKDPDGSRLYFTPSEWDAFARGTKGGAFDGLT